MKIQHINNLWKDKLISLCYFMAVFVYLEFALHITVFSSVTPRIIYPILFALVSGSILYLIASLFPEKLSMIAGIVLISLLVIYFEVQLVYHCIFGSFMPLSQVGMGAGAITNFFSQMIHAVISNLGKVIIILIPLPLTLVLFIKKIIKTKRITLTQLPVAVAVCLLLSCVTLGALHLRNTHDASAYALLVNTNTSTETSVKNLGVAPTLVQELKGIIFGIEAESEFLDTTLDDPDNRGKEVNATVNFNTADDAIGRYLSTVSPTAKNEYTGIAKDYNLITICAEAFSPYIIDEELTPALYKLSTNGIVFNNFYNSFPNTTTNGEYCFNTGLFPDMSRDKLENSFNASAANYMPLCLGNLYTDMGYKAYGYHNYYGTFYDRHITHKNMGYDFKAILSGLDMAVGSPSSDLDMIEASMPDYLDSTEPFHVYYMTYSGHYQYNWENEISAKNRDRVEELPYSDEVKAYIACHLELEYALAALMEGLEEAGKADNTVIVLTGDHYPYGLSGDQYDELAGYKVERSFEKYRNSFICYIPGIETVEVDSYCSTPDILPTVLNIMGIEYDSRLLAGRDVLSNAEHIAVLADRSFIAEDFRYNAATGEVISDSAVDADTLSDYRNYVDNMFTLSSAILESDYYALVYGNTQSPDKPVIINYEDIDNNNVYKESTVTFMVNEGFMEPKTETVFGVDDPGTVKEFIEVLYRIKKPSGYADAFEWASSMGVSASDSGAQATYIDIARVVYGFFGEGSGVDISDLSVKYPHIPKEDLVALKFCYDSKIIMGETDSSAFDMAYTPTTRFHIAAFLQRIYMYGL